MVVRPSDPLWAAEGHSGDRYGAAYQSPGVPAARQQAQLFNPGDSARVVLVDKLSVSTAAAAHIELRLSETPLGTVQRRWASFGQRPMLGAAEIRNLDGTAAAGFLLDNRQVAAFEPGLWWELGLELAPGWGLVLQPFADGVQLNAGFVGRERPE